jgi:hypothetical protein
LKTVLPRRYWSRSPSSIAKGIAFASLAITMLDLTSSNIPHLGFFSLWRLVFIVGRTREPDADDAPRAGIRDFVVIALIGASVAHLGQLAMSVMAFAATASILLLMRWRHPERLGITTEFSAVATFILAAQTKSRSNRAFVSRQPSQP